MKTFTAYIQDERYTALTLKFFSARGEAQAREIACYDLMTNPHHLAVEVCDGDQLLFIERRQPRSHELA